jgi:methionyl-tRNA formyltransferase
MTKPKILVFAYSDVGYACLTFLLDRKENIIAVYTHEDKPEEKIWFPSVKKLALDHSIPVRTSEDLKSKEELTFIQKLSPDLIFSFYYRNLIPLPVLKLAALGAYNMHGSYLPYYRGRAPINWAVLRGETKTGATLHVMEEKADAGDIVDQESVIIGPDDTAAQVQVGVTKAAVKILTRQIENLKSGKARRTPQNHSLATYFGRRRPEDGGINWNWPAHRIHNLVRALTHPYPGAFGEIFHEKTWIWQTCLSTEPAAQLTPGTIQEKHGRLFVVCGERTQIEILRIQKTNEEEISGAEYLLRCGPSIKEKIL